MCVCMYVYIYIYMYMYICMYSKGTLAEQQKKADSEKQTLDKAQHAAKNEDPKAANNNNNSNNHDNNSNNTNTDKPCYVIRSPSRASRGRQSRDNVPRQRYCSA